MTKELFVLPVPMSLFSSPVFHERPGRASEIISEYEEEDDPTQIIELSLVFENQYAVRITNCFACDIEVLNITYARVVDLGETNWLKLIKSNVLANKGVSEELLHLGIYFDDDCLYEFVCGSFHFRETRVRAMDIPE